jgi:hypothetical protein
MSKNPASQMQETVFISQPPQTSQNQSFPNQTAPQANWSNTGVQLAAPPKPKSRGWLWVVGIFGAIIVFCGGGLVGLIALVANSDDGNNKNTNLRTNTNLVVANSSPTVLTNVLKDDLSEWKLSNDNFGKTDFQNGEFWMTSKAGYNFALLSKNKDFRTDNRTTKVTVRNPNGKATSFGYGLLVHNNVAVALLQDYAFLIDSINKRYRVARHQARKETTVIEWTNSDAIHSGTQENVLEVKDENGKMTFFINGKSVTTVNDSVGIKNGVAGLFVNDAIPIAFSNLQVGK